MITAPTNVTAVARYQPPLRTAVGLAIAYALGAWVSSSMSDIEIKEMNFWLPGGMLAGALFLVERRYWVWMVIAGGIGDFGYNLTGADPWPFAWFLMAHTGNSLAAICGVALVQRFTARQPALESIRELIAVVVFVGVFGSAIAATSGTLLVRSLGDATDIWASWLIWFSSDVLGVLLIVPLMLAWRGHLSPLRFQTSFPRPLEGISLLAGLVLIQSGLFYLNSAYLSVAHYGAIPFQIWAVIRFGPRGVTLATLTVALLAGWFSSLELTHAFAPQRGVELQISLAMFAFFGLLLAVVFEAHRQTARRLQQSEDRISRLNQQLERNVITRTAELQTAVRELESFSYSVAHDLRSPLRGIDGWSHALTEDCAEILDAEGQGYLQRIRDEAQRMGSIIDDLLDLARVNRSEIAAETVNLSALAEKQIKRLRESEPAREIESRITPDLVAHCDPRLAQLLLQNLIGNAWKFTSQSPAACIEVGRTETTQGTAFFVRDNGVGFDVAQAATIFAPFSRLHRPADFPGTGVGLAIVQRIVHRHHGDIWVDAAIDQGATFYFQCPEA